MILNIAVKDDPSVTDEQFFASAKELMDKNKKSTPINFLISGSRLASETTVTRFADAHAFSCNQNLLERVTENALQSFTSDIAKKNMSLASRHTLSIKLNGYEVSKLDGQKANEISITTLFVAIDDEYKKKLLAALPIGKDRKIEFDSLPFAQAKILNDKTKEDEFILASAYAHSMDISVRKGNGFFETYACPLGTFDIIRHIANGLGITEKEAETSFAAYNEQKLAPELIPKLEDSLQSFLISLDNEMKKAFDKLARGISLPSKVYVEGNPAFKTVYEGAFRNDSYHSLSFTEKGFEVAMIEGIIIP